MKFWDHFVEVDGRVGSYTEHVIHWFIILAIISVVAAALIAFLFNGWIIPIAIVSIICAYFSHKADIRINGDE